MTPTGDEIGAHMARQSLNVGAVKAECSYCGDRDYVSRMYKTESGMFCRDCSGAGKVPVAPKKPEEISNLESVMKQGKTFTCAYCGKTISKGNMTKMGGKWACKECAPLPVKNPPSAAVVKAKTPAIVRLSAEYAGSKKCFYCGRDLFRLYNDGTAECACGKKYAPEGVA